MRPCLGRWIKHGVIYEQRDGDWLLRLHPSGAIRVQTPDGSYCSDFRNLKDSEHVRLVAMFGSPRRALMGYAELFARSMFSDILLSQNPPTLSKRYPVNPRLWGQPEWSRKITF